MDVCFDVSKLVLRASKAAVVKTVEEADSVVGVSVGVTEVDSAVDIEVVCAVGLPVLERSVVTIVVGTIVLGADEPLSIGIMVVGVD